MTRIKLCGLSRIPDIEAANELGPEYIGFVFAPGSSRCVTREQARILRRGLSPGIAAVGVFVDENAETIASLMREGIIDLAQLHGHEDEAYIARLGQLLRGLPRRPDFEGRDQAYAEPAENRIIRAFRVRTGEDAVKACESSAGSILLDSGAGTGKTFNWQLAKAACRPYFLAGGLDPDNVGEAIRQCAPFAVDVSSGIETGGSKDPAKMAAFVRAVRLCG